MTTMTTTAPFALIPPARAASPLLVEVPHAGLDIPPEVRGELAIGDDQLLRDSDIYVDRLCAEAPQLGATLLVARVARCVVDLNRDPADGLHPLTPLGAPAFAPPILPRPHGVVWTVSTAGEPILRVPFTPDLVERRVARYHAPYHATLRRELERLRATFGFAVLLAAHSMPSWGVDPRTGAWRFFTAGGTRELHEGTAVWRDGGLWHDAVLIGGSIEGYSSVVLPEADTMRYHARYVPGPPDDGLLELDPLVYVRRGSPVGGGAPGTP